MRAFILLKDEMSCIRNSYYTLSFYALFTLILFATPHIFADSIEFDIFFMDGHIGKLTLEIDESEQGYIIAKKTDLSVERLGQRLDMSQVLEIGTDSEYNFEYFTLTTIFPEEEEIIKGIVKGDRLEVSGGGIEDSFIAPLEDVDFETLILLKLERDPDYLGLDGETEVFYPEVLDIVETEYEMVEEEGGYKLNLKNKLGDTAYHFGEDEGLYKIEDYSLGFPLIIIREDFYDEAEIKGDRLDLIESTLIPLRGDYERGSNFILKDYEVREEFFPPSDMQSVRVLDEKRLMVELGKFQNDDPGDLPNQYLSCGYPYFCEDESIKKIASSLTGDIEEDSEKVKTLCQWVHQEIQTYDMTHVYSDALSVLSDRSGDCSELATLLIGLLRAIEIPARTTIGFTLHNDHNFYLHMWVEAHYDGGWHSCDPTLMDMEIPHIKIDNLPPDGEVPPELVVDISRLLNHIKIEVEE